MEHQAFAQLLGNYGEFVGAVAVVATLFYLAVQVRHSKEATEANTHSLEESRKLASAQAYQARSAFLDQSTAVFCNSDYLPDIAVKFQNGGIESLSAAEALRLKQWLFGFFTRLDNIHFQYQRGFIDDEFYNSVFLNAIRANGTLFREFEIDDGSRPSFKAEIERICSDATQVPLAPLSGITWGLRSQ